MQNDLKVKCMRRKLSRKSGDEHTHCGDNIGDDIAKFSRLNGGLDIVALQEAPNDDFINMVVRRLGGASKYGVSRFQGLATIYKKARFQAPDVQIHSQRNRRPQFAILAFDNHKLLFANVHNSKSTGDKKDAFRTFPSAMHRLCIRSGAFRKADRKRYRVILAGDFNDQRAQLPGSTRIPWLGRRLALQHPFPRTCCSTQLHRDPHRFGDFIFDSATKPLNRIPETYDTNQAKSDHRPVESILR